MAKLEIMTLEPAKVLQLFHPDLGKDARTAFLEQLDVVLKDVPTTIESKKERDVLKSTAAALASLKNRIDEAGAKRKEEAQLVVNQVNADRSEIWDELETRQKTVRDPLTKFEEAEKERKERLQAKIDAARLAGQVNFGETSTQIQARIDSLPTDEMSTYDEFEDEAKLVIEAAYTNLVRAKTAAINAEAEAAVAETNRLELAALRDKADKAEREQAAKDSIRVIIDIGNGFLDGEKAELAARFKALDGMQIDASYGDLRDQATQAYNGALRKLYVEKDEAAAADKAEEERLQAIADADARVKKAEQDALDATERADKLERDRLEKEETDRQAAAQKKIDDDIAAENERLRLEKEDADARAAAAAETERQRIRTEESQRIFEEIVADITEVIVTSTGRTQAAGNIAVAIVHGKIRNVGLVIA